MTQSLTNKLQEIKRLFDAFHGAECNFGVIHVEGIGWQVIALSRGNLYQPLGIQTYDHEAMETKWRPLDGDTFHPTADAALDCALDVLRAHRDQEVERCRTRIDWLMDMGRKEEETS